VLDALEVVRREEKNKSLQQLFKELNDNTTNAFEYGKNFLAYLLTTTKKVRARQQHHEFHPDKIYVHRVLLELPVIRARA
jgi:hypothetical protein